MNLAMIRRLRRKKIDEQQILRRPNGRSCVYDARMPDNDTRA